MKPQGEVGIEGASQSNTFFHKLGRILEKLAYLHRHEMSNDYVPLRATLIPIKVNLKVCPIHQVVEVVMGRPRARCYKLLIDLLYKETKNIDRFPGGWIVINNNGYVKEANLGTVDYLKEYIEELATMSLVKQFEFRHGTTKCQIEPPLMLVI